jgi:hypothetical protein
VQIAPEAEIATCPPSQLRRPRRLRPRIPPVIRSPPTDPAPPAAQAATSAPVLHLARPQIGETPQCAGGLILERGAGADVGCAGPARSGPDS